MISVPAGWTDLPFFADEWPALRARLEAETRQILPPRQQVFAALEATPPERVRVVILGQDPYPTPGHAHGLAFSVDAKLRPLPRSLSNIFAEMQNDLGVTPPNGDLHHLARQGVLLLNTVLTVPAGEADGHKALGWQVLTRQILARVSATPTAYVLWGAKAQKMAADVDASANLKIETAHPSPLSARRGFFGSRPFSQVNAWLQARGGKAINWADPEAS